MRWTCALVLVVLPACFGSLKEYEEDASDVNDTDGFDLVDTWLPDVLDAWDTPVDTTDVPIDTGEEPPGDALDDTAVDAPYDTAMESDAPCTGYPPGPYDFASIGNVPGPASWPSSIKGSAETSLLAHADLQQFYCDPTVQSVLVFYGTLHSSTSPARIAEMTAIKSHFDTYGAKWIWLLAWDGGTAPTTALAESYFTGNGVAFGWFTDDADNTWESYGFHNSELVDSVPWIIVMDAETMQVAYNNPTDVAAAVMALGTD
jgi:hypothetical protein